MGKRKIIGLAAVVFFVAATTIGVRTFTSSAAPRVMPGHITIAQARGDRSGQAVKVGGDVVPGSIGWDDVSGSLRFTLAGGGERMSVAYPGRAPNDFKPGSALIVEGKYTSTGIFDATSISTTRSPLCKACHG